MGTVITPRPEQWRVWVAQTIFSALDHLATGSRAERNQYLVDRLETLAICKNCKAVTNNITPKCLFCGQDTQTSLGELLDYF